MARKTGKANGTTSGFSDFKFVNVSLSSDEKRELERLAADPSQFPVEGLFRLAASGYKLSINRDKDGGGYLCSATDLRPDSPSGKWVLVGRGSTPFNAWVSLAYKHFVLLSEDWSANYEMETTGGNNFG